MRTMRSIAEYCTAKRKREMEFLRVPRGVEERERILHSCHTSKESEYDELVAVSLWSMRPIVIIALFIGGHLGRDKTFHRGSSGRR